jgi:hypothetical protein
MKRLLLSVLGGFAIPFLYAITTGPLSLYIASERINYLLWIPIGWPKILYLYLFPPYSSHSPHLDDSTLLIVIITCDVLLYGSLTYLLLWIRMGRKPTAYTEPPPPHIFGQAE